jgi:hypothetical protein
MPTAEIAAAREIRKEEEDIVTGKRKGMPLYL